jgi:formylglycine-generating enzyme required for sulfatase activity
MDCTSLGDYRFAHFSFQEFLVAKAIVEQQCVEALRDVRITAFLFTMFLQAVERSYTRIGDEKISPIQLKSMQFRGLELEGMTLKNICFEECDFSRASIRNSLIQDCFFKRSNLGRADFTGSRFKAVAFEAVSLEDTVLESSEALCKYAGKSNIALYISAGGNELVRIPGGEFLMGEGDQHEVRINDFYLGGYPVTNEEFGRFLETNLKANKPGYWRDPKYNQPNQPVVGVSWDEARAYCEWAGLRLPSEAEWEYACRAGTTSRFWSGDTDEDLARVGWYLGNSDNWIHAVGEKEPNPFGLFDMHGNVWEWVEDDWHGDYNGAPTDGSAWEDKQRAGYRVYRGGSFGNVAGYCQSAVRRYVHLGRRSRHLGFRPARSIP